MMSTSPEERFRDAAEAEGGTSVSAGARVWHVRRAVEAGRMLTLDLSLLPVDKRPLLIQQIQKMVNEAVVEAEVKQLDPAENLPHSITINPATTTTPSGDQ